MFAVEVYASVRQFVFVEGHSKREAARVFGLARETVDKICRFSVPPGYRRTKPPEKRKLGAFVGVIDAILAAATKADATEAESRGSFTLKVDAVAVQGNLGLVLAQGTVQARTRDCAGKGTWKAKRFDA